MWTTEGTSAQGLYVSQHGSRCSCQRGREVRGELSAPKQWTSGHQRPQTLERRAAAGYLTQEYLICKKVVLGIELTVDY